VLFEASTTSGSNVPEGNERVVCSGLFYIFSTRRKKMKECVLFKNKQTLCNFFFLFFGLNFCFFFLFFFFFFGKSCKYTRANITKVQFEKCVKQKTKKKLQNKCQCNMLLCVIFTTFRKRVIRDIRRYIAIEKNFLKNVKFHILQCVGISNMQIFTVFFFSCKTLNLNVLKLYKTSCTILRFLQI